MPYDLLLGRDSGDNFRVMKHRDSTHERETIVTFTAENEGSVAGNHGFRKWVNQAIGMIERPADCKVVVRYADKSCVLSEGCTRGQSARPKIPLGTFSPSRGILKEYILCSTRLLTLPRV